MVAWWSLDEISGTVASDLIASNDGHHINGPLPTAGMVDGALAFDGIDDYVEVPDDPALNFGTGDFSIDMWVKTTDASSVKLLLDKRYENTSGNVQGYSMFLNNGKLAFQLADGAGSWICSTNSITSSCTNYVSSVFVADGQWHLLAVTVDRDTIGTFYVDGVAVGTFNAPLRSDSLDNAAPLRLGSRSSFLTGHINAIIDEVELFDRVLANSEIVDIYNAGPDGKCKCVPETITYTAGIVDEFAPSPTIESTTRSSTLDTHITYLTDGGFDEQYVNRFFGHTFTIPSTETRTICNARLEIRVKSLGELDRNDSIGLNFITTSGPHLNGWGRYFGSGNASDGLNTTEWGSSLTAQTFVFDLAALPLAGTSSTQNIVGTLNALRFLDVTVQDDTSIDYVKFIADYCCENLPPEDLTPYNPPVIIKPVDGVIEQVAIGDVKEFEFPVYNNRDEDVEIRYQAEFFRGVAEEGRARSAAPLELTNASGTLTIPAHSTATIPVQATLLQTEAFEGDLTLFVDHDGDGAWDTTTSVLVMGGQPIADEAPTVPTGITLGALRLSSAEPSLLIPLLFCLFSTLTLWIRRQKQQN